MLDSSLRTGTKRAFPEVSLSTMKRRSLDMVGCHEASSNFSMPVLESFPMEVPNISPDKLTEPAPEPDQLAEPAPAVTAPLSCPEFPEITSPHNPSHIVSKNSDSIRQDVISSQNRQLFPLQDFFTNFVEERLVRWRPSDSQHNNELALQGRHPYQKEEVKNRPTWWFGKRAAVPETVVNTVNFESLNEFELVTQNTRFRPNSLGSLAQPIYVEPTTPAVITFSAYISKEDTREASENNPGDFFSILGDFFSWCWSVDCLIKANGE